MTYRFLLCLMASLAPIAFLSCSGEIVSAEIVNAVVNNADFSSGVAQASFPSPLPCRDNRYLISGGSYRIVGTAEGNSALVDINISMDFPKTAQIQVEDNLRFTCDMKARYTFNATTSKLTGSGEIATCDDFRCEYRGEHIDCNTMKEALSKYTCQ